MESKFHFRRVDEPFADPQIERWQVEHYDLSEGTMFPNGTAWVVVLSNTAQLNFILVGDAWRKRGIGKRLILACKERWPSMLCTGPMSDEGEALLKSLEIDDERVDVGNDGAE